MSVRQPAARQFFKLGPFSARQMSRGVYVGSMGIDEREGVPKQFIGVGLVHCMNFREATKGSPYAMLKSLPHRRRGIETLRLSRWAGLVAGSAKDAKERMRTCVAPKTGPGIC